MTPSKKSTKKSTTVVLIATTLAITILSSGLVEAKPTIPHKPDLSHAKGTSPWPKYGEKPDTNTPEVKAWVKTVNWDKVPKLPIRYTESPGDPPECPKKDPPKSDCWWTCTGCYAPDDVMDCPGKNQWGLTFDDGPEPGVTEDLFDLLDERNVTATFFVTGMKSIKAPWLLQETIDRGHHLASHTWSHSGLTTLTNEEIVAELKWTEKYIFDHTGYKIRYFRPPYGDVDNRVRGIARELGFKTVIWTNDWDTQDWQLPEKTITQKQIVRIFNDGLDELPDRDNGIISLEHDGDQLMVGMAKTLLTMGMENGMKPMSIAKCINDPVGYNQVPAKFAPKPESKPAPKPAPKPAAVVTPKSMGAAMPGQTVQSAKTPTEDASSEESLPGSISEESTSSKKSGSSRVTAGAGFAVAGWTLAAMVASLVL